MTPDLVDYKRDDHIAMPFCLSLTTLVVRGQQRNLPKSVIFVVAHAR